MKSLFFLPAVALAGGQIGESYGQDYDIAGGDFSCDIDGNATYIFEVAPGHVREVNVEGKGSDCEWKFADSTGAAYALQKGTSDGSIAGSTNGNTNYTVKIPKTCFDKNAVTEEHTGRVNIYVSAKADQDLFFGKVWQNMKCTMKRDHEVTYKFTQIMLDTEGEGALMDGTADGYELIRTTSAWDRYTSANDTKNVTSGEKVYFEVNSLGDYTRFPFDLSHCKVSNGANTTYFLTDLHNTDSDAPCKDTFLSTEVSKRMGNAQWRLSYEAFTFVTENESNVELSCGIKACLTSEHELVHPGDEKVCPGFDKDNCKNDVVFYN